MVKIDVPFTKNCAQFLKNRIDEQKFARNNRKSRPAVYKYCAHPSTNAHPPEKDIFHVRCHILISNILDWIELIGITAIRGNPKRIL